MTNMFKLLVGGAAIAGFAVPAAAQYYPQQAYPQYYPQQSYSQPGYAYPQQGYSQPGYGQDTGIAGIISQLLGNGNRYSVSDRTAVTQCATAAQAKASTDYRPNGYGYDQGYREGYGQDRAYNQGRAAPRVTGITNVQRRGNGLRVSGVMSSGMASAYGNQRYGQGYNTAYAAAASDLTFRCNVDSRGAVTGLRVDRNQAWRG